METIKLTPKQNAVIYCLQNGWVFITDMEVKGALVCNNKYEFRINNGLFYRLIELGLVYQGLVYQEFVLTELGKRIKTKKIEF